MPYTSTTKGNIVTVYKKNPDGTRGKVVGHTTKGKKKAYLAALHINSKGE
jgi:hypothetical protein